MNDVAPTKQAYKVMTPSGELFTFGSAGTCASALGYDFYQFLREATTTGAVGGFKTIPIDADELRRLRAGRKKKRTRRLAYHAFDVESEQLRLMALHGCDGCSWWHVGGDGCGLYAQTGQHAVKDQSGRCMCRKEKRHGHGTN